MPGTLLYLDSSALVRLVLPEPETEALLRLLPAWPWRVVSAIAVVEVQRAARRSSTRDAVAERARRVLAGVHLVAVDDRLIEQAGALDPPPLRSLDALHLATALSLGGEVGAFVVYDERLAEAARAAGLTALSPA